MSTVIEILDDIVARLPREKFQEYGEPGVLRAMNRKYKEWNRAYQCLENSYDFTTDGDDLPADFGKEFDVYDQNEDALTYVDPDLFDDDEDGTYTIKGQKVYFGSFTAGTDTITMWYFSTGLSLVAEVSDADTEVASPEWFDVSAHGALYYAVVAELDKLNQEEMRSYANCMANLKRMQYDRQSSTPDRSQPHSTSPKNRYIDDYEYPYTRHT